MAAAMMRRAGACTPTTTARRPAFSGRSLPGGCLPSRRGALAVPCASKKDAQADAAFEVGKALSLASVAGAWLASGQAQAATEVAQLAGSDNRTGLLLLLFVPVLGWVGYNILSPALSQVDRMTERLPRGSLPKKAKAAITKRRSVAAAIGLSAAALSLAGADQASAAVNEVAQVAADNRFGIILTLFVPVLGWVLFNILSPALSQLGRMGELRGPSTASRQVKSVLKKKRSVMGPLIGLGAGASALLALADTAQAAEMMPSNDGRFGSILILFVPVLAWVGYNIVSPALGQLDRMGQLAGAPGGGRKRR